ncbi:MAG: YihY/virulence factor BrkB family protein [Eubacteriales bacterium]|nr:YihY/virulence factor BrkB family protein [Eubacteriales bacterium]
MANIESNGTSSRQSSKKAALAYCIDFGNAIAERRLPVYAASGCYHLIISLVPITMIFCCLLPYTPLTQDIVLSYVDAYLAPSLASIVRTIVDALYQSDNRTLFISILLALISASAAMRAMIYGLNAAYSCRKKQSFPAVCLRSIFYIILLISTLLISLLIMVYGGKILSLLHSYLREFGIDEIKFLPYILSKRRYFMVMAYLFPVFLAIYALIPNEKLRIRNQVPGAIFSSITWVIFSYVFTIYVNASNKYGPFGVIGTFMVAMIWVYYCFFFLLIGGFLNDWLATRSQMKKVQSPYARTNPDKEIITETSAADTAAAGHAALEENRTVFKNSQ